ncbi:unnamed protein product, partial [Prorocentrum cordatum]
VPSAGSSGSTVPPTPSTHAALQTALPASTAAILQAHVSSMNGWSSAAPPTRPRSPHAVVAGAPLALPSTSILAAQVSQAQAAQVSQAQAAFLGSHDPAAPPTLTAAVVAAAQSTAPGSAVDAHALGSRDSAAPLAPPTDTMPEFIGGSSALSVQVPAHSDGGLPPHLTAQPVLSKTGVDSAPTVAAGLAPQQPPPAALAPPLDSSSFDSSAPSGAGLPLGAGQLEQSLAGAPPPGTPKSASARSAGAKTPNASSTAGSADAESAVAESASAKSPSARFGGGGSRGKGGPPNEAARPGGSLTAPLLPKQGSTVLPGPPTESWWTAASQRSGGSAPLRSPVISTRGRKPWPK